MSAFQTANALFERLWAVYPRKEAKEPARAAWHQLLRRGALPALDTLLAALDRFRASASWNREHGRFVPQLANWLRGRRWLDEAPEAAPAAAAGPAVTEQADTIRLCRERLEQRLKQCADPALEAARPDFEAFLSHFSDGQQHRGPAWGLWALLHSKGKAPRSGDVNTSHGVMKFLCSFQAAQGTVYA